MLMHLPIQDSRRGGDAPCVSTFAPYDILILILFDPPFGDQVSELTHELRGREQPGLAGTRGASAENGPRDRDVVTPCHSLSMGCQDLSGLNRVICRASV